MTVDANFDPFDPNNISIDNTEIFGCTTEQEKYYCRRPNDQTFFRVDPRKEMQMTLPLFKDKSNGDWYLVPTPEIQQKLARDLRLVLCRAVVTRDHHYHVWPIPHPTGTMGMASFESQRAAAEAAEKAWLRVQWNGKMFEYINAEGNIPEPQWCPLNFRDLLEKCFASYVIVDEDHAIFKQLKGL